MKDHASAQGEIAAHRGDVRRPLMAVGGCPEPIARVSRYRLRELARDEEKAALAFLDDRHGHPYKVTEPVQAWISELCTDQPQVASSRVQSELQSRFGVAVSVSQINRVRAKLGVSHLWRGRNQGPVKKN
jgi:transposase